MDGVDQSHDPRVIPIYLHVFAIDAVAATACLFQLTKLPVSVLISTEQIK